MKKLKYVKFLSIFMVFLFSLQGCMNFEKVEITNVKDVKIEGFFPDGVKVNSKIKISNPNPFDITITNSNFAIFIKGQEIGKAKFEKEFLIPSKSHEFHELRFLGKMGKLNLKELANLVGASAFDKEGILFKVDGEITGKTWLLSKTIKVSHEEKVPLQLF